MKSTQLLSVVFSLIMFTGVTAGNAAFAESDDLDDILEGYCEMNPNEQSEIITKYGLDEYAEKLAIICEIENDEEREESLESVIDTIDLERDEMDDDSDDVIDDFEDCVEAGYPVMESFPEQCMTDDGTVFVNDDDDDDHDKVLVCHKYHNTLSIDENALKAHLGHGDYEGKCDGDTRVDYDDHYDLDDLLDRYCTLNDEEKRELLAEHPRLAPFTDRLANYCDLSEDEQDAIDDLIEEHGDQIRDGLKDYAKDYRMDHKKDMRMMLDRYCDMTDEDKKAFVAEHDKAEDHVDKMNRFCALTDEDSRMDFIMEHKDEYISHMKDKMYHTMTDHMDYKKDMRMMLDKYCDMTDAEKKAYVAEHDKAEDKVEKMNRFCALTDEDSRMDFIMEHKDEYISHMKDKMHDKMSKHMDYDRLCDMADSDRAKEVTDVAKLDKISQWCEMTPEEREDYKKEHHGDKVHDKVMDKVHDKMKLSDKSDRIKAMIMDKRDISDERKDEIKMKYIEKHGDLTDAKKSELKMKFANHMKHMKVHMSDEQKSSIHDRVAEMKAFKAELREKSSEMTEQEKQQLRSEFIEKAKDMQLAWINPRIQMTAGIDAAEVQCREGFDLVMKASNGAAMCLKADTALKMIDRGIVVPAI